jgi:ankyrin repeat protein
MPSPRPIAYLPPELLLVVAEYLPLRALSAMSRTCRYYNSVCDTILTDYLFEYKDSIVHCAAISNRPHIIYHCLKKGVNLGHSEVGADLFSAVANWGSSEVLGLLLDVGADPNCVDSRGKTPLYYAVAYGRLEMASMLVEKGAQANYTVHRVLHETRDDEMKELLKKHKLYKNRY